MAPQMFQIGVLVSTLEAAMVIWAPPGTGSLVNTSTVLVWIHHITNHTGSWPCVHPYSVFIEVSIVFEVSITFVTRKL